VSIAANILVILVALLHVYFLVLEMFLWDKPRGMRTFRTTPEFAAASKALAANQGLYNGFLAAGLIWGVLSYDQDVKIFFLACVIVAGVYGAVTVSRRILWVQALPAAIALGLVLADPWPAEARAYVIEKLASAETRARHDYFECGRIGGVGFEEASRDGALVFYNVDSKKVISVCGGVCWRPGLLGGWDCATRCPPRAWKTQNCDAKKALRDAPGQR
jgi:putative membrane protein